MLNAVVLGRWLDANAAPGDGEEPLLEQLTGGSQNTLYLIHRGDHRMVLRMPGARADAARIDGLLREIRLVRALGGTDVPHAELIAANDAGDRRLESDGRGLAVAVRRRPHRTPRPGVRAHRGRGQTGPGGLAGAGAG